MIGKLTGSLEDAPSDGSILISVGGVGYVVRVSPLACEALGKKTGETVSLFIHTSVREDAIELFGFLTHDELLFFRQLTSVSGIGPKTALGILNSSDIQTLKRSIARGDSTALTKIFGIGKKSAERVVVELRDKLADGEKEQTYMVDDTQVVEALLSLGYRSEEARHALKTLMQTDEQSASVSERVTAALKILSTKT